MDERTKTALVESTARVLCRADGYDPDGDWRNSGDIFLTVLLAPGEERRWTRYRDRAQAMVDAEARI